MHHFKIIINENLDNIRRLSLDELSYNALKRKLETTYPNLYISKICYKDDDQDLISILSDEDLQIAFDILNTNALKLFLETRDNNVKNEAEKKLFHPRIICDGCDSPIYGIRYKCSNCNDFDLCSDCESKSEIHQNDHIFLKIKKPLVPGTTFRQIQPKNTQVSDKEPFNNRYNQNYGVFNFGTNYSSPNTFDSLNFGPGGFWFSFLRNIGQSFSTLFDPLGGFDYGTGVYSPSHHNNQTADRPIHNPFSYTPSPGTNVTNGYHNCSQSNTTNSKNYNGIKCSTLDSFVSMPLTTSISPMITTCSTKMTKSVGNSCDLNGHISRSEEATILDNIVVPGKTVLTNTTTTSLILPKDEIDLDLKNHEKINIQENLENMDIKSSIFTSPSSVSEIENDEESTTNEKVLSFSDSGSDFENSIEILVSDPLEESKKRVVEDLVDLPSEWLVVQDEDILDEKDKDDTKSDLEEFVVASTCPPLQEIKSINKGKSITKDGHESIDFDNNKDLETPEQKVRLKEALDRLQNMGYVNEGEWLTILLRMKQYDVAKVLDIIHPY